MHAQLRIGVTGLVFGQGTDLFPYFGYVRIKGSGETAGTQVPLSLKF